MGFSYVSVSNRYIDDSRKEQLEVSAKQAAEFSVNFCLRGPSPDSLTLQTQSMRESIAILSRTANATTIIIDNRGRVVLVSEKTGKPQEGQLVSDAVLRALARGQKEFDGTLDGLFENAHIVRASPMIVPTGPQQNFVWGYALTAALSSEQALLTGPFIRLVLSVSLLVLFVALVVAYWLSRRMTKPLKMMARAANSFSRGEFDARVRTRGHHTDEIGELTDSFNSMADALEKSERLRSEFIANVSHELKTPMTTVSGYITGILDGTIPPERQQQSLETVRAETMRLSRLVSRMLDLARLQGEPLGNPVSFDLTELICRTVLSFEGMAEKKELDMELNLPEEKVKLYADPDAITQVVYNLLDNAIKHTPQGGHISLSLAKRGSKLTVAIRNDGDTIPPEELRYIFERFHKAEKSRGVDPAGLGLGLYIVKTILGNMNEKIWVTSERGITTFTFTLSDVKRG